MKPVPPVTIEPSTEASGEPKKRKAYEAPRVVWREPYEPMSFGISCAKQPGNPQCMQGPVSG